MSVCRTERKPRTERDGSGPVLSRGEACLPCRRKKSRCDGTKPCCKQCAKLGQKDGCEYQDSRFIAAISTLEERVRTLQGRICHLEGSGGATAQQSPPSLISAGLPLAGPSTLPSTPSASVSPTTSAPSAPAPPGMCAIGEQAAQCLLKAFYPHASVFGMPQLTVARLPNVHPSLLEAIYAASCHFAPPEQATLHLLTNKFISRAEMFLAQAERGWMSQSWSLTGLRASDLEKVQAQVILATLLLADQAQSVVRALGHAGGAMRVANCMRLSRCTMDIEPEGAATYSMVCMLEQHASAADIMYSPPPVPLPLLGQVSPAPSLLGTPPADGWSVSSSLSDGSFL